MPKKSGSRNRLAAARQRMYRDLVFESAEHVFAEKGFEDATMQEIAAEAGISLKTLYAHFPGKNELYAEIQTVRGNEFVAHVAGAHAAGGSALDALARGVRAYVDFLVEHPDFLKIHLREREAWGLRAREDETGLLGLTGFVEVIERGIEEGTFYEGDADLLARMGIAVIQVPLGDWTEGIGEENAESVAEVILVALRRLLCRPDAEGLRAA
ncbi:MAG: TetR/AcrR family transcriptional regulator [Myxococcota bacterium]|nr:TetR/AcrR family transcriptional regulator [Myxococcota bacterium]